MIKLNTQHQPFIKSYASHLDLSPARRLVVLVPGPEADLTPVAKRIGEMANVMKAPVRFLGLCTDATQEPSLRRILVTQSALFNSGGIFADTEIIVGKDWATAVTTRVHPGDMFVCWNEPTGFLHKKVNMILEMNQDLPAYIVAEPHLRSTPKTTWLPAVAAWVGSIAIILVFFWLQVEIELLAKSIATGLDVVSVVLEFWLLMVWNKLFA